MSRLTFRQKLIAIAIGIAAAVLQANTPPKAVHAAAMPPASCAVDSVSRC